MDAKLEWKDATKELPKPAPDMYQGLSERVFICVDGEVYPGWYSYVNREWIIDGWIEKYNVGQATTKWAIIEGPGT